MTELKWANTQRAENNGPSTHVLAQAVHGLPPAPVRMAPTLNSVRLTEKPKNLSTGWSPSAWRNSKLKTR